MTASQDEIKYSVVTIKENVPLNGLDNLIKAIEEAAEKVEVNTLVVLAGKQGTLITDVQPAPVKRSLG